MLDKEFRISIKSKIIEWNTKNPPLFVHGIFYTLKCWIWNNLPKLFHIYGLYLFDDTANFLIYWLNVNS